MSRDRMTGLACGIVCERLALSIGFPCAVLWNGKSGTGPVLHIRSDRFNHQIELVGAVDLPKSAIDLVRCNLLGFGEVVQPVDSLGVAILHDEHEAGTALRPRKQREVV